MKCDYCGTELPDDAGSYYHRKECEARSLEAQLRTETDPEKRKTLEARLEEARYVGG